jgi:hypothetical protein
VGDTVGEVVGEIVGEGVGYTSAAEGAGVGGTSGGYRVGAGVGTLDGLEVNGDSVGAESNCAKAQVFKQSSRTQIMLHDSTNLILH